MPHLRFVKRLNVEISLGSVSFVGAGVPDGPLSMFVGAGVPDGPSSVFVGAGVPDGPSGDHTTTSAKKTGVPSHL